MLWLGIPLASLRVASWLSDTGHVIFLGVLFACPIAMVLWGWALYRLNDVYLQLTRQEVAPSEPRWLEPATRPSGVRRESMLLDKMLVVSVLVALIALFVWFFLLAPGQQWPTGPF